MENQDLRSVRIAGIGTIEEGNYNEIKVSGSGKILGNVKAKLMSISGSCKALGDVEADEIKISGSCRLCKAVKGGKIHISGAINIVGECSADELTISGTGKFESDINADTIEIHTANNSELYAQNIFGDNVKIISSSKMVQVMEIEATKIHLESVKARRISGNSIYLDAYCNVDTVEYSEELKIESGVNIRQIIKL